MKLVLIAAALALSACSSLPPKEYTVVWHTECSHGTQAVRIKFIDTNQPVIDCIKHAHPASAAFMTVMTLLGAPPGACAIGLPLNYMEIYAPMSPGAAMVFNTIGSLTTPEDVVEHELRHAFGSDHPLLLSFIETCQDRKQMLLTD